MLRIKISRFYVITLFILTIFLVPDLSSAQDTLFGAIGNGSQINPGAIIQINQISGAGTFIGDAVTPGGLSGIDFDSQGRLFGSTVGGQGTNSTLVEINPQTGALIDVIGDIQDGSGSPVKIGDLAFQPRTDVLYGIGANNNGPGGDLFTIDTTTAVATFIGSVIGRACGLAFAPDGTLYCWEGDGELHIVNPNTGSILSTILTNPSTDFIDAAAVRSDGTIFGALCGECANPDTILTVDPDTGDVNFLGDAGQGGVSDLAFLNFVATDIPTLSEWGLIALAGMLGLAGFMVIRRRKAAAA